MFFLRDDDVDADQVRSASLRGPLEHLQVQLPSRQRKTLMLMTIEHWILLLNIKCHTFVMFLIYSHHACDNTNRHLRSQRLSLLLHGHPGFGDTKMEGETNNADSL